MANYENEKLEFAVLWGDQSNPKVCLEVFIEWGKGAKKPKVTVRR